MKRVGVVAVAILILSCSALMSDGMPRFNGMWSDPNRASGAQAAPFSSDADVFDTSLADNGQFKRTSRPGYGMTAADHSGSTSWAPDPSDSSGPHDIDPPSGLYVPQHDGSRSSSGSPPNLGADTFPQSDPMIAGGSPNAAPGDPPGSTDPVIAPVAAAPEPATWISMIIGFGMLGTMLRAPLRRAVKA